MPEYSGYINPAEAKANPTLDWGSVINDVQSTLAKQEQQREANRQNATKEANDLYSQLSKVSTGQSQTENEFITNAAYQAKKNLAEVDKLYRSGKIKANEYANIRGNMSKMFTDINDSVKGLQDDYKKYIELSQSGNLSAIADFNQNQKGKAFDLSNKKLYIDPMSGKGYLATVIDSKGNIDKNNLIDPSWLKTNQSYYTPKVDVLGEVSKYTKDLGKFEQILQHPPVGGIWTVDNVAEKPEFNKWLNDVANAVASDPVKMASILADYSGSHTLTSDPKNTEADKIVMQRSLSTGLNTPALTAEQEKLAKDAVKNAILVQVDKTMKQQENTYHAPVGRAPSAPKEPKFFAGAPTVDPKGNVVIPMSGVNVKSGNLTENVTNWGKVGNSGKLFIDYIGAGEFGLTGKPIRVYEGNPEFNRRAAYLVNPSTGQRISSIQEAKQYANSLGGTQQKTSTVQKGAVVDGYKFLGGDPANQKNWKKI
jgi:hypothetical protein